MKKLAALFVLLLLSVLLFVLPIATRRSQAAIAAADLSVTKVDSPDPVNTGSNLTYTITVTNNGPDAATNASWTDTLPAGTTFAGIDDVSGWSCSAPEAGDSGTVSCSNPSFAVGSSVFSLTVAVAPTVPAGSILSNTATVTSSTPDGNPDNNSGTATTTVLSPSVVTGNKSRSGGGTPGSTLSYLIILSNSSNSDQQDNPGNEFTDVLSADLTLVGASASSGTATANTGTNTVTWNGVVPAQDSVTITIDATIKPGTEDHTITNQGTISYDADGNGTNEASATTNVDSFGVGATPLNADLGVTKTAPDSAPSDSDVTYTITVVNGGPDTATSATLTDTLPGDMTFVSLSQPAGWNCTSPTVGSGGTLSCLRDLPAGSGAQVFTMVGHIPSGTADGTFYNNMATVSTTAADSTSENDVGTAGTTVMCVTDPVVTTNGDSGAGSLRRAIEDACDGSTITFDMTPGHVVSPITLTSAELVISKSLTIQGPGANLLTISGNDANRVFEVNSGVTVSISGLTIANGKVSGGSGSNNQGGGIYNSGTLNVVSSTLSHNSVSGGCHSDGGGIYSNGTLTLTNSTLSNNSASGSSGCGGGNFGGGIYNTGGTLTLTNSTLSGNSVSSISFNVGGGIYNDGTLNIRSSTLSGNSVSGSSASFNGGGGIYHLSNTLTITNSTLSGNSVSGGSSNEGGGVFGTGFTIASSTVSGNSASGGSSNEGGGIYNPSSTPVNARNTIVAANTATTGPDVFGALNSQGHNLFGNTSGVTITGDTTTNILNQDPKLGPLASHGGPTQTHLLLPNSPAIDSGDDCVADAAHCGDPNIPQITFDQRDTGFLRKIGTHVDIGPVEVNYLISATGGTPQSTTINTAFGTQLRATVTEYGNPISGVTVTFTAPESGPSGTFPGSVTTATAVTNASGVATAPTFTANGTAGGPYNVVAGIGTGQPTATFALTNTKAATTTAVTSSPNPSNLNQSVTFSATVSSTAGTPTGTVQFKDGGTNLGAPQALNGSGVATFSTSSPVAGVHVITADYSGDSNFLTSTGTLSGGQQVGSIIRFSSSSYDTTEGAGSTTITVQRIGDLSQAVSVEYSTPDDSSAMIVLPCSTANGVASPRCDFETALGTLRFAAGDGAAKTFTVLINQDSFVEGPETLTLTLSNLTGGAGFTTPGAATLTATLTITDDVTEPATNPIDDTDTFVRQQYRDFLNREPDASGLAFWKDNIDKCNDPARRPAGLTVPQCIDLYRINTSAAFFLSIEFQDTGYFVERIYKSGFGDISPPTVPVPVRLTNFLRDTQEIGAGVIVGQGNWQAQIDNNKNAFALSFVQRSAFLSRYPAPTSATEFVDSLNTNAGGVLSDSERSALIAELSPNPANPALRASVLKKIADNATLKQREFNRAFVLMEYFGYLRRNPDAAPDSNFNGYNFWLNKLNQFNGNFVNADMVKAFLSSGEYRQRFGP